MSREKGTWYKTPEQLKRFWSRLRKDKPPPLSREAEEFAPPAAAFYAIDWALDWWKDDKNLSPKDKEFYTGKSNKEGGRTNIPPWWRKGELVEKQDYVKIGSKVQTVVVVQETADTMKLLCIRHQIKDDTTPTALMEKLKPVVELQTELQKDLHDSSTDQANQGKNMIGTMDYGGWRRAGKMRDPAAYYARKKPKEISLEEITARIEKNILETASAIFEVEKFLSPASAGKRVEHAKETGLPGICPPRPGRTREAILKASPAGALGITKGYASGPHIEHDESDIMETILFTSRKATGTGKGSGYGFAIPAARVIIDLEDEEGVLCNVVMVPANVMHGTLKVKGKHTGIGTVLINKHNLTTTRAKKEAAKHRDIWEATPEEKARPYAAPESNDLYDYRGIHPALPDNGWELTLKNGRHLLRHLRGKIGPKDWDPKKKGEGPWKKLNEWRRGHKDVLWPKEAVDRDIYCAKKKELAARKKELAANYNVRMELAAGDKARKKELAAGKARHTAEYAAMQKRLTAEYMAEEEARKAENDARTKKREDTYRILRQKLYADDEEHYYMYIHPWAVRDDGPAKFADMLVEASDQFTKFTKFKVPVPVLRRYEWEELSALVDGSKLVWENKSGAFPPDHRYWVCDIKTLKGGLTGDPKEAPKIPANVKPAKEAAKVPADVKPSQAAKKPAAPAKRPAAPAKRPAAESADPAKRAKRLG
jgi:hypothetical protein